MVPPSSNRVSRAPPYSRIRRSLRIRGCHPLWPAFPDRSAYLLRTTGLLRVRSSLLAESRLMSFPPGMRYFSSPGLPRHTMDSCDDTPKGWVAPFGHPRINACSRLPVAFRSVPRPSSPPGAKASTECPSLARDPFPGLDPGNRASRDAHPPCTETILRGQSSSGEGYPRTRKSLLLSTQQSPLNTAPPPGAEAPVRLQPRT